MSGLIDEHPFLRARVAQLEAALKQSVELREELRIARMHPYGAALSCETTRSGE